MSTKKGAFFFFFFDSLASESQSAALMSCIQSRPFLGFQGRRSLSDGERRSNARSRRLWTGLKLSQKSLAPQLRTIQYVLTSSPSLSHHLHAFWINTLSLAATQSGIHDTTTRAGLIIHAHSRACQIDSHPHCLNDCELGRTRYTTHNIVSTVFCVPSSEPKQELDTASSSSGRRQHHVGRCSCLAP